MQGIVGGAWLGLISERLFTSIVAPNPCGDEPAVRRRDHAARRQKERRRVQVRGEFRPIAGPGLRRQAAGASLNDAANGSRWAFIHSVGHRTVGRADEFVEVFLAHLLRVEHGQHVDGAVNRFDERDVSGRQSGWRMLAEPIFGESGRARTDELAGGNSVPCCGLLDQIPLGVGETDGVRVARTATVFAGLVARSARESIFPGQLSCSLSLVIGYGLGPFQSRKPSRAARFQPKIPCPVMVNLPESGPRNGGVAATGGDRNAGPNRGGASWKGRTQTDCSR